MNIDDVELEQIGKSVLIRVPDHDLGVLVGIRVNPAGYHPDRQSPSIVTWINKLPDEPELFDLVSVVFHTFDSPAEAARSKDARFSYSVDASLKLTVGDRVRVPFGRYNETRTGTVVALNAPLPPAKFKLKRVIGRA